MKRIKSFLSIAVDGILLVGLGLVLIIIIRSYTQKEASPAPPSHTSDKDFMIQETASLSYLSPEEEAPTATIAAGILYPPPLPETPEPLPTTTLTPTATAPLPAEQALRLMGKVATLSEGNILLLEPDKSPLSLTDSGDVSVIFGWNKDGNLLLFGRGRIEQPEFSSDTTDLWILDTHTRETRQFTSSGLVNSAAWSPVADEIAYTENGDLLTVADLKGTKLHQLDHVLLGFNWSPDGSAIAVRIYTPDMVDTDGLKYTVLAVWWLPDEKLHPLSDAKNEVHTYPIWSMDGQHILFVRILFTADQQKMNGLYIVDVASGSMKYIENTIGAVDPVRSPRADLVAYYDGKTISVTDFLGQTKIVTQGRSFAWLPDGRTLYYRTSDGSIQLVEIDTSVADTASSGQRYSVDLYIQPEYYIMPGGQP